MNTTFKLSIIAALILALTACSIQGPWDYDLEEKPPFAGIFVYGQLVADLPVENICFDRLYQLDEMYTTAFSFYNQAQVQIKGVDQNGTDKVILLSAVQGNPNCFTSTENFLPQKGKSYQLTATFNWDSAGTVVNSVLTSTANIPTSFEMSDSARASSDVLSPGTGENIAGDPIATFQSLPPKAQEDFLRIYGDTLSVLQNDSALFAAWIGKNIVQLSKVTDSLLDLYDTKIYYKQNDSIYFLWRADTRSHFFKAIASPEIKSIVVTHRFEDEARIPLIGFMQLIDKSAPKPEKFFYKGQIDRLKTESRIQNKNFSSFDTLGVVNTWFVGGKNTLYFYGMEAFYDLYDQTVIQSVDNPLSRPRTNINGGFGYFVGSILDSFVVNVKIPKSQLSYTQFEANAAFCVNTKPNGDKIPESWEATLCRPFKMKYCKQVNFNDVEYAQKNPTILTKGNYKTCFEEKVWSELEKGTPLENSLASMSVPDEATKQIAFSNGTTEYCIRNGFKSGLCDSDLKKCQDKTQASTSKTNQRNWCKDNSWAGVGCDWALALYCRETNPNAPNLCKPAKAFCAQNPTHVVCQ